MDENFLKSFGIIECDRVSNVCTDTDFKTTKEIHEPFSSFPDNFEMNQRIREDKQCLLYYPISSSGADRLSLYQSEEHYLTFSDKTSRVCEYEKHCCTSRNRFSLKLKSKPSKEKDTSRITERKKLRRCLVDGVVNFFNVKKRCGPTARVKSLNLSSYSPFFQFSRSPEERRRRHRNLEYGLNKAARHLARHLKSCSLKISRVDPLLADAYANRCRVLVDRLSGHNLLSSEGSASIPQIALYRLTPDQVATGLVRSAVTLQHESLEVRLFRLRLGQSRNMTSNDQSMTATCLCQIEGSNSRCLVCPVNSPELPRLRRNGKTTSVLRMVGNLPSISVDSEETITPSVNPDRDPIFLTPYSRPHQRSSLLDPEEMALPGDVSMIPVDHDSGESYEVASLASSSATSAVNSTDNSIYGLAPNGWRKYTSSPLAHTQSHNLVRKNRRFHRTASYPQTSLESSSYAAISKELRSDDSISCFRSRKRSKTIHQAYELPSSSKGVKKFSSFIRKHRRLSYELGDVMLTRGRSKRTQGIMLFEKRSRSSSNSKSCCR